MYGSLEQSVAVHERVQHLKFKGFTKGGVQGWKSHRAATEQQFQRGQQFDHHSGSETACEAEHR